MPPATAQIVPRQFYATPYVPPVIRRLLIGLEEVWTWLRVRWGLPMDLVLRILLPRGRDWKFETPRPPRIIFLGDPTTGGPIGAAYAGGNVDP